MKNMYFQMVLVSKAVEYYRVISLKKVWKHTFFSYGQDSGPLNKGQVDFWRESDDCINCCIVINYVKIIK